MSKEHIRAIARLDARPEKTEEPRALLISLLEPTRQERGYVRFELQQNRDFATEFAIVSEWCGEDAVQHHIATSNSHPACDEPVARAADCPAGSSFLPSRRLTTRRRYLRM